MKSFSQMGMKFNPQNDEFRSSLFEVTVTSDYQGKMIAIADVETWNQYILPADLIAFWLEHGTEAEGGN